LQPKKLQLGVAAKKVAARGCSWGLQPKSCTQGLQPKKLQLGVAARGCNQGVAANGTRGRGQRVAA